MPNYLTMRNSPQTMPNRLTQGLADALYASPANNLMTMLGQRFPAVDEYRNQLGMRMAEMLRNPTGFVGSAAADVFPTMAESEANLRRSRLAASLMQNAPDAKDDALRKAYAEKLTNFALQGIFAGPGAKTADTAALARAYELKAAGVPDRQIHAETGWMFGFKDGKPRFEIPDDKANFRLDFDKQVPSKSNNYAAPQEMPIGGAYSHSALYDAYPDILQNTRMTVGKQPDWMPDSSATGAMTNFFNGTGRLDVRNKLAEGANSTTIHELQHAVQNLENFQRGGMEGRGGLTFDQYRQLAGEVEARLAQQRLRMTPQQRRASYPPDMFDVPIEQQITR